MTAINSNRAIRGPVTAVPFVAGKGVRLVADTQNNRWVVEADKTTLFETSTPTNSCTLSETLLNFEKIAIYSQTAGGASLITLFTAENGVVNMSYFKGNNYPIYVMAKLTFNGTSISADASIGLAYTWGSTSNPTIRSNSSDDLKLISKVVGINRIASN